MKITLIKSGLAGLAVVSAVIGYFVLIPKEGAKVCFASRCFRVELAVSQHDQETGLMFRHQLKQDRGMLFVFEEAGSRPFWMKDMLIPLDILWIGKDNEVVYIARNVIPCSEEFCPVINPLVNASYVLEINAGLSEGISVGDNAIVDIE